MPLPCSGKRADKFGSALRDNVLSDDDLAVWAGLLDAYGSLAEELAARVGEISGAERVVSRVKTLSTLAEKLRRFPAQKLTRIDDIAGCRVVCDDVSTQSDVVAACLDLLPRNGFGVDLKDRRWRDEGVGPSHGYRAMHLIVRREGMRAEIQIRTELQHAWAQLVESLGDVWGRELRYGLPLQDPDGLVRPGHTLTRRESVDFLMELSVRCEELEKSARELDETRIQLERVRTRLHPSLSGSDHHDELMALEQELDRLHSINAMDDARLRTMLKQLQREWREETQ